MCAKEARQHPCHQILHRRDLLSALRRLSAFIVSLLASGRKVRVGVEAIGFLVVRGVTVTFAQVRSGASSADLRVCRNHSQIEH